MPAYNYKKEFAEAVKSGLKPITIRGKRKYPTRPGAHLTHFYGQRTKQCELLRRDTCRAVVDISITAEGTVVDGQLLCKPMELVLAKLDGFPTVEKFREFFRAQYGLPTQNMEIIIHD